MSSATFVDRIDPFAKRSLKKKTKKSQGSSRYRNSADLELQPLPLLKGMASLNLRYCGTWHFDSYWLDIIFIIGYIRIVKARNLQSCQRSIVKMRWNYFLNGCVMQLSSQQVCFYKLW